MNNVIEMDKVQALKKIEEHSELIVQSDIKQSIHNSLAKLNEVEMRINKIENKSFLQRFWGSITGQNDTDMVVALKDLTQAQQINIQLVLSLASLHAENLEIIDDILGELKGSKGTYSRIADHIDYLYGQVEIVKLSIKKKNDGFKNVNRIINTNNGILVKVVLAIFGIVLIVIGIIVLSNFL